MLHAQFRYIAHQLSRCQKRKQPTISVDTQKKELAGDFKTGSAEAYWLGRRPMPVSFHTAEGAATP